MGMLVLRPEDEKSATERFGVQRFEAKGTSTANTLRWELARLLEQHQGNHCGTSVSGGRDQY